MVSRILIKLIDQSIIPAFLLVAVRVVSLVFVAGYFGINFKILGGTVTYPSQQEYVLINSYSIVLMLLTLSLGIFYILLKSFFFHETHISPHLTAKVFSLKISALIQKSMDLYSQGAIWMSYLYLIFISTGVMALSGLVYSWVFYIALILTVVTTTLFLFDIENEMDIQKEDPDYSEEEVVLSFGRSHE
jgi:hypothetical protein